MLTYEEAHRIAAEYVAAHLGPGLALIEDATIEKPYGWLFGAQSRAYLETGDESQYLFGLGGLFVERDGGRVFTFGSRYSWDTWLSHYEKGFRYDFYDLTILSVRDRRETVRLLARLEMREHVREWEHGVEWLASRPYTARRIRGMLDRLPCAFRRQGFADQVGVFDALNAAGCCTYRLEEHREVASEPG